MINLKHDYYVNPRVIKPMINMIAKQMREHKIMIHISMDVSNTIHVCQGSNNHGILIIITKQ